MGEADPGRVVLEIAGADRESFLQGLITQDIRRLSAGPLYAALLTPQGKYLADFLLVAAGEVILLDVSAAQAGDLLRRLTMYRLRADVQITQSALKVSRGLGEAPEGAVSDPRHPALGWRLYAPLEGGAPSVDWDAIRVAHVIPEAGIELIPNETYILEAGFERLSGVDFRKGCYVGQEVTARMKHKTELRKGFAQVSVEGEAVPGTPILQGGKEAGMLFTRAGGRAIAWLRFDRAEGEMQAGEARVRRVDPAA
ncbi:CAF17-like 4Fe-4S cluster assembly/insertion protein YgfZ [Falsigemmobacter faecalis]|uniref:Folate-binding protein n=1 Tax=Falsigemmobacter faecalis TaxID=2488730 RepID=A0A3P3DLR1_9RHOB|nr:folate-binding protein YgfZ [Falsigemmobacter faecalis]RRH75187.1 folate-binding protein [Falsigemmobacter faecalis]